MSITDLEIKEAIKSRKADPTATGILELRDDDPKGLALRITPKGKASWSFGYRMNGKATRVGLGEYPHVSLKLARNKADEAKTKVKQGVNPVADKRAKKEAAERAEKEKQFNVFGLLVDNFIAYKRTEQKKPKPGQPPRLLSESYIADIQYLLNSLKWNDYPVKSITTDVVYQALHKMKQKPKDAKPNWKPPYGQIKHLQIYLKMLFKFAKQHKVIDVNPMIDFEMPVYTGTRDNFLTDAEVVAFWHGSYKISPVFGSCLRTLLLTCCRKSEIADLRWNEIHDDHLLIPGSRTKSGVDYRIPLSPLAKAELAAIPKIKDCPFVFTINGRTPITGFDHPKAKLVALMNERLGDAARPWMIHDTRRTVTTFCAKSGIPPEIRMRLLNHSPASDDVAAIHYDKHNYFAEKQAALQLWADHITALLKPKLLPTPAVEAAA